jgi:hypothetical protein
MYIYIYSARGGQVGDKALAETHKAKVGFATRVVFNTDVVTCGFSGLPSLFAPLIKAANLAAGNGFINPYADNAIGKLLYWSVKENKWRYGGAPPGSRDGDGGLVVAAKTKRSQGLPSCGGGGGGGGGGPTAAM